ncbi:hypothetical protein, partial [Klebsiella pneumoniae]|uniref:hypothetical protein n=2 Tax=Pseudomonadota TaxID=1224 RepID=UPI003004227E
STRDEDGEPHWTQSVVVRDVLADAKAALDGAPQPAQADARVGLTDEQINAIMEQAQVFASAWSLIGGIFDNGDAQVNAEQERSDLRELLKGANHG